jgi:hypothetical protein
MLFCDKPTAGTPTWGLHDYFAEKNFEIMGEPYEFCETGFSSFLSTIEPVCVSRGAEVPENYSIAIGDHNYSFGLSYGWSESTFHQSHRWSLGKWRQDLTEKEPWWHLAAIGESRQFTNLDEIRCDAEKELARVIARWEHYQRTGHYPLQWGEVAAMLAAIRRRWDDSERLRRDFDHDEFHLYLSGKRGGSFRLELVAEQRAEHSLWITATRSYAGWRFDVFAPYSALGDCPWYETIVIGGDYRSNTTTLRCPLPHKTPHEMSATVLKPWELKDEVLATHVPNAIRDTPRPPYPSSLGW